MADDFQRPDPVTAAATKRTRTRTVAPVSAEQHNRVLEAALKRVDRLEPRLARIVEPILARQGELAAERFRLRATNHLAAAAANTGVAPTSMMVCVRPRPDEAEAIADPDGDPPEILHVTLAYLGKSDDPDHLSRVAEALKPVAASLAPLEGVVGGYGVFDPAGVGVLLPDVRGLVELRIAVCEALLAAGIDYGRQHGFCAHLTVNKSDAVGNVKQESYAETVLRGAGEATAGGGRPGRDVPGLREESVAEALGSGEGGRGDGLRPSHCLDVSTRASSPGDPSTPPLRERSVFERRTYESGHELGARSDNEPAPGEMLRSRDAVLPSERKGARSLSGLPSGSYSSTPSPEEGSTYPAPALGRELHFDSILVVRGNTEEVELPLVGIPSLTAAGDAPPPAWTAPFPDELINVDALVAELLSRTEPVRKAMVEQTMTPSLEQAGLSWSVSNPLAAQALASSASQVRSIAETTQLNVMRVIGAAYRNGLSIPQTSSLIQEGMKSASGWRATMIARTELTRAANAGSLAATGLVSNATGTTFSKTWRTAPGAPHPRHEDYPDLDGQTVPLDGTFQVGEDQLQYPGDPDGSPEETIQCRCTLVYGSPEGVQEADAEDPPVLDSGDSAGGGGGGGPITLPGAALSEPLSPLEGNDAASLASTMTTRAAAIEPALTDAMQSSADAVGAKLVGLDFRLKSAGSAARKIADDAEERDLTLRETAYSVSDMVRYTAELPADQYVAGTRTMLTDLQDRGFRIARFRNTWTPDAPYAGVNVQMAAENGYRFELQFHTPESWAMKNGVQHPLYEEWRLLPPTSPRAIELSNEMAANTATLTVPPGVRDFQFGQPVASTEIGVTPFRAGEDPIGFYDSAKYQQFTDQVQTTANQYGVTVDGLEHMTGVWQGETEPSVAIRAHDGELGLRAFASSLGQSYNQDGVLLFGSKGTDVLATFPVSTQEEAFAAMRDAGFDAGRLTSDGRLQIIGPEDPGFLAQLKKVSASLGDPGFKRGSFGLLERDSGDYQRALDAFQSGDQLALRSPARAVENTTSSLDPTGKQIDEALSTVGEYLSFPGQVGGEPAVDARIVGDPYIGGIPVEGVFNPSDMTIKVRRLTSDPRATFTHELGHPLVPLPPSA